MVHVRAIGATELRIGRLRIRPSSERLFALVLYLASTAGRAVPRSRLLELFWPRVPQASGRHSLRQLLWKLRRSGFKLSRDGEELLVEAADVDSDLATIFEANWLESASAEAILAAASVLPGYGPTVSASYSEWLDELRARIAAQFRRAAVRQISLAQREARWVDLEIWALRCLDVDPLNQEATLAHAVAKAMMGAAAAADRILDHYLAELGTRGIKVGLPAKMLKRRLAALNQRGATLVLQTAPFIGRAKETSRLNELLTRTAGGRRTAVLIVGAAGIGKTALAQQVVDSAQLRGWRSIAARLQASDSHRPLAAFVVLFSVLIQLPGALGCAPAALTQLQRLTQHGVEQGDDAPRSQESEAVQQRIRASALELLSAVCEEGPLIVRLEDLQWSDGASARLLQQLVERSNALPVLWLLTTRPTGAFTELRESLREELVETLRLEPLGADESVILFRSLADRSRPIDETVLKQCSGALTGGNPFFIREVARHYCETGNTHSLPGSLRALIHERVERLPSETQHVLHTCAVLGRYSSVARIASVLELSTAKLLRCLGDLDALGILGAGDETEALGMHDLWQEDLLASLSAASRQLIHQRCGEVLEAESRDTRSASMVWEAARHLIASGARGRALNLLDECAQHLLENGLPADAAQTFALAFDASTTDPDRLRALTGRITALHRAARWTELSPIIGPAIILSERCSKRATGHSHLELLQTELLWRTEADPRGALQRALRCLRDETASLGHRASAALTAARTASNLAAWSDLEALHQFAQSLPIIGPEDRANLLAVEMPGRTFFEIRYILHLARESRLLCPPELASVISEREHDANRRGDR